MTTTEKFHVHTVLTVTTGKLLTRQDEFGNGIDDLYKILEWMTGEDPMTHQLPRFAKECRPWLLRWFPELRYVVWDEDLPKRIAAARGLEEKNVILETWVASLGLLAEYDVPKIPADDHASKDAVEEMCEMVGPNKNIIVVQKEE